MAWGPKPPKLRLYTGPGCQATRPVYASVKNERPNLANLECVSCVADVLGPDEWQPPSIRAKTSCFRKSSQRRQCWREGRVQLEGGFGYEMKV